MKNLILHEKHNFIRIFLVYILLILFSCGGGGGKATQQAPITETFNFKKYLFSSPNTLWTNVQSIDTSTGEVVVNGAKAGRQGLVLYLVFLKTRPQRQITTGQKIDIQMLSHSF